MPTLGGYETRRVHSIGALSTVYEAVAGNGAGGRFAVRVFHPPKTTTAARLFAVEGWLLAAERQTDASARGRAVLEVFACGRCEEGAYAVHPWVEHSLEPLIETMYPRGNLLRAVATILLDALTEWEKQFGGPHGKIKGSNAFLSGSGPLATLKVCLSDPWFVPGAKAEVLRHRDLNAVGSMLVQVVRRRKAGGWPIEEAPEWRALGRAGAGWLALCNYLMNPNPRPGDLTLEEARRQLDRIPWDARPGRNLALVSGGVVVIGAGSLFGVARFTDPQNKPMFVRKLAEATGNPRAFRAEVTPDWALLCRAWASWLSDLQRNADRWDRSENFWAPEDPLRDAVHKFRDSANDLRPQVLVPEAASETRLGFLAESPPENVRHRLLYGTVAEKVSDAWAQVEHLATAMELWPRWAELRGVVAVLEKRGFMRAAGALRTRLPPEMAKGTPPDVGQTLKLLNDFSLDDTGIQLVASRWAEIQRISADMEASGDRVQKAMPRLILAGLTDQPSVGDFADSLAEPLAQLQRRRAQFLDPAVVRARFLKESGLQSGSGEVTAADVASWEKELAAFSKVPAKEDPRAAIDFDGTVARVTGEGSDLEPEAPAGEAAAAVISRPEFDLELQRLKGDLASLRGREIVRRDVPGVTEQAAGTAAAFRALEQRVEATLALLKPGVWLKRMAEPYGTLAAVRQRWQAWQTATLTGLTSDALDHDRARFRELRQQQRALRDWLEAVEGLQGFGALKAPDLAGSSPDVAASLASLESERREQAAAAVIAAASWRGVLPAARWSEEEPAVRAPLDEFRTWLAGLPGFAADLDRLNGLLESGASWNEGIADVLGRLGQTGGIGDLTGAPAGWVAEARTLSRLAQSSDRAELTAAAKGGALSRRLTVWRRLGALQGWPADASELDLDGGLVAAIRDGVDHGVKDAARRDALDAELSRETRIRWNHAARNAAHDEGQLSGVFERMDRYGIRKSDLEAPVAYNLTLWQFKHALRGETDIGRVRSLRDTFLATVGSNPAWQRPETAGFLASIAQIDLASDAGRKPTASPARLPGWTEQYADDGLSVTASWSGSAGRSVHLDFLLVQPTDDTLPFFLAKRAIAVGEFLDLVSACPGGADVIGQLPRWASSEDTLSKPFNRPMAWRPRADFRGIELNPTWIYLPDAQVKALLDDTDLRVTVPALAEAETEKPGPTSPLQQVPPGAAKVFVENLVGARLPSPQEWGEVMKIYGTQSVGTFRGPTFENLWRFLAARMQGGQGVRWRPNEGVFLPLVTTPGGPRRPFSDDGHSNPGTGDAHLWMTPVDVGPSTGGFVNLNGNVWVYLYDNASKQFYVAGGSALSPPGLSTQDPLKVEASGVIGARRVTEGFSDVGVRPAFDAPPGLRMRLKLLLLVREQPFLTL